MEAVYGVAQEYFELVIKWGILLCEVIGFLMIILTAVRGVIAWIRKDPHARLIAAEGIAIALTFKHSGHHAARRRIHGGRRDHKGLRDARKTA